MQEHGTFVVVVDDTGDIAGTRRGHSDAESLAVRLMDTYGPDGSRVIYKVFEEGVVMYTTKNFRTKKALKEAVASGAKVTVYQPNGDMFGKEPPKNGTVSVEGPHYPEPHRWYAQVTLTDGVVTKVS